MTLNIFPKPGNGSEKSYSTIVPGMGTGKAMNINSNATSAIVDSLFRLVQDGSTLHRQVGARHRGAAGVTGKQTALSAFGSLSGCFSVLSADRLTGLRCADAPRTSLLCHAIEPKHETYYDARPGSVLAL